MRFPLKLSALLALLLLGFTLLGGTGVGAQETGESSLQPEELEGFEYGAMRSYTPDFSAMMASPGADMEMPTGLMGLGAMVFQFDDNDHAEDAYNTLKDDEALTSELITEGSEEIEVDLGDNAVGYKGSEDMEGMSMETTFVLVQDGKFVYFIYAAGTEVDVQAVTEDLASHMIDTDGEGEGEYSEDGTSTGGVWDKFPKADDDLVEGLIASDDELTRDGEE